MKMKAQTRSIRRYLKKGHRLTQLHALELFGCMRLSARIYDLRQSGVDVKSELVTENGKKFSAYYMEAKPS